MTDEETGGPRLSLGGENFDRLVHGWQGRLTQGVSPPALGLAFLDWWVHLANAPGFQAELAVDALRRLAGLAVGSVDDPPQPPDDHRFADDGWDHWPFDLFRRSFQQMEQRLMRSHGGTPVPLTATSASTTTAPTG